MNYHQSVSWNRGHKDGLLGWPFCYPSEINPSLHKESAFLPIILENSEEYKRGYDEGIKNRIELGGGL